MDSNDIFDFSSMLLDVENWTADGGQFVTAGICSLSDVLDMPLIQLYQAAIMKHYRTCSLNYSACNQLIELLKGKGINVMFDENITPDISFVPKVFSSTATENEAIIAIFDRLVAELGRTPSIEELAYETGLPQDRLRNNTDIKQLALERQQVRNYIEWFCKTHSCELHGTTSLCNELREVNWSRYPYNLFLDVVPAVESIKGVLNKEPGFFARLIQKLENLVYFDLTTEEKNAIAALYVEGAICFREPSLQWGLEYWSRNKKHGTIRNVRRLFQGGKLLAEKGLLGTDAILGFSIEELGLSTRSYNRLKYAYTYIDTIAELVAKTKKELSKLRQYSLEEVVNKVHQLGLCFADEKST